jgi:CRP-like cAMP-binding protein
VLDGPWLASAVPGAAGRRAGTPDLRWRYTIISTTHGRPLAAHSRPDASTIAGLRPFAALEPAARQALAGISRLVRYHDGEIVTLEGDADAPVHFVLEGAIRVFRTNLEGREQTLILLRQGDALNLPGAFAQRRDAVASAMAAGDARTLAMGSRQLQDVVLQHPAVGLALLQVLADRLHHLSSLTYDLSLLSVRARLARFLLAERQVPQGTSARWTHAQIAARVGTVRVVVSRTLSAMAEEGLIRLDRHRIEIVDAQALACVAEL